MSTFECRNFHIMKSGEMICGVCGERLMYMDGMTDRELRREEGADNASWRTYEDDEGGGGNEHTG